MSLPITAPRPAPHTDGGNELLPHAPPTRRAVNWRSVTLGLVGVVLLCAITPYNNYVMNNNDLVGNALPTGMLLFTFVVVLLVNAPLHRFAPRQAFSSGELAVAMGMVLVACAVPSVGLMRYLPGHLVAIFSHASQNNDYAEVLRLLRLPDWMFPTMSVSDPAARGLDPVVRDYVGRVPLESNRFIDGVRAVPWRAGGTPALSWGAFFGSLFGAVMCLSLIFRRQWVENERLPFPLASVCLSLIESPPPGKALNRLFRSRGFWVAFVVVFGIHCTNSLAWHFPKQVPVIPLRFDLRPLMAGEPLKYTEELWVQQNQLYFTIVGITLFVQTKVSFSLWFFFVAVQVVRLVMGMHQKTMTFGMEVDQIFGALVPFGITILWVARQHLLAVFRQMFRGPRGGEPVGRYLPHAVAGWGLVICLACTVGWLL